MHLFCFSVFFATLLALGVNSVKINSPNASLSKCGEKEKVSNLLDVAKDFVTKAKDMIPTCNDSANCGKKETSSAFLDVASNLISQVKKNYPTCPEKKCPKHFVKPMDCSEVLRSGKNESGVYRIWPRNRFMSNKSIDVYCDMKTLGGGWTVIQRRGNFSTPKDFFVRKNWADYKKGFGNLKEEFWIGNDNIYAITNQDKYKVRFDLVDYVWEKGYAEYDTFRIEGESNDYNLHIEGYSGNVKDALWRNDDTKFSTSDRRNDKWHRSCVEEQLGAWWHSNCTWANLNGVYQPDVNNHKGITWFDWKRNDYSLRQVEIKLRAIEE